MNEKYFEGQEELDLAEAEQITGCNSESSNLSEWFYEDSKLFLQKLERDSPGIEKKALGTTLVGLGVTIICTGIVVLIS